MPIIDNQIIRHKFYQIQLLDSNQRNQILLQLNPFQAKTRTTVLKNNSEHKCEQFAHQCNPLQTKCVLILNHLSKPVRNVRSFYNLIISTEALFNHSVFISQIMTIHQSKLSYTKTLPKTNFNVIPHLLGLSL
ncbi:Hypothetical_protein [Hexamita inflata]|uniref:Hypothetical_protein n=1 Tax=Hexamita inflata TaxID=28002 RepID=A0AA86UKC4_9EUKA|nr:Hypothetical protein HINF_LOCUS46754 [Hexamita inflata]